MYNHEDCRQDKHGLLKMNSRTPIFVGDEFQAPLQMCENAGSRKLKRRRRARGGGGENCTYKQVVELQQQQLQSVESVDTDSMDTEVLLYENLFKNRYSSFCRRKILKKMCEGENYF